MKKSIFKYSFVLIIPITVIIVSYSCNNNSNTSRYELSDSALYLSGGAKVDSLSGIHEFYAKWIKVTEMDSGKFIYNPCDAANHEVEIVNDKGAYFLIYRWGHELTEHKISSFKKNDQENYRIGAYFGNDHYYYNVRVISKDIFLSSWNWAWKATFDNKEDSYYSLFVPEEYADEFDVIDQPCLECWGADFCVDFIRQYIGMPFESLLNDTNFQNRISLLYDSEHKDFLERFDPNDILKITDDRYIILSVNIKDGGEPVEKILVIDVENNIIGSAFTKNGSYMYAICEVGEDSYPEPLSQWISKRK